MVQMQPCFAMMKGSMVDFMKQRTSSNPVGTMDTEVDFLQRQYLGVRIEMKLDWKTLIPCRREVRSACMFSRDSGLQNHAAEVSSLSGS